MKAESEMIIEQESEDNEEIEEQLEEIETPNFPVNYDSLAERFHTTLEKCNITPETYKTRMINQNKASRTSENSTEKESSFYSRLFTA